MCAAEEKPRLIVKECKEEEFGIGNAILNKNKPIVLSSQRYNKITNNAFKSDKIKAQQKAEEEHNHREYLKAGNDQLVAHFKGNMQRTQEKKMQEMKEQMEKKEQQVKESYEQAKENAAQKRSEKIAKAQQMLERLKPGPRELHSAVLQSEVLRARNIQRSINEEFKKAIKLQESETQKRCENQGMSWINDEQRRLAERQKNTNSYKQELLQTISENQRQKAEQKKQIIREQQAARDNIDSEMKAQIAKEKAIMEKKKALLRKNALEAMKMVEQRRLRDRMVEEVEDRLCCVYNTGKRQLDNMRAEQAQKILNDKQSKVEEQVKQLTLADGAAKAAESERLRRDISTMQLKFTAEEEKKVRKVKAAKQARIVAYLEEMQEQKKNERKLEEEKRFEMAQRYKNAEVDCLFNEAEKLEKANRIREMRNKVNEQIEETKRIELAQKQAFERTCPDDEIENIHKFFLEYAHTLMEDAQKKGRPLFPFIKVIQKYKRDNMIDCERKTPKHLESHISIGVEGPGTSKSAPNKNNLTATKNKEADTSTRDTILKSYLKINEIIANAENLAGAVVKSDNCIPPCLFECDNNDNEDGPSMSSSAKLRYSMNELKKMNQFADAAASHN
uniref:Trichohyalin-plectin-homology domain-containing protein n=1 Tax=Glossina pallidipes TaxID=7398 RepID=A0A1A9ZAZ4_GLOPL